MANTAQIDQSSIELLTWQPGDAFICQSAIELMVGLGISCGNPPGATKGTFYSHAFPAGSGDPPYTFSIVAGSLPPGLSLDPLTGIASGVPTTMGTFSFTVQVEDSMFSVASTVCTIIVSVGPLSGLRILLRGVKRFKNEPEPEPCECPEGEHVGRAV